MVNKQKGMKMKIKKFRHGQQVRLDVRSKAKIVEQLLQKTVEVKDVVHTLGFSPQTVKSWVRKLGPDLNRALKTAPGTPWLVPMSKISTSKASLDAGQCLRKAMAEL